jgi:hypothetical protein
MPSNVSFSQFPVEIMDAIVNVDSDLDVRPSSLLLVNTHILIPSTLLPVAA